MRGQINEQMSGGGVLVLLLMACNIQVAAALFLDLSAHYLFPKQPEIYDLNMIEVNSLRCTSTCWADLCWHGMCT